MQLERRGVDGVKGFGEQPSLPLPPASWAENTIMTESPVSVLSILCFRPCAITWNTSINLQIWFLKPTEDRLPMLFGVFHDDMAKNL
jgi:hypothetical protein